MDLLLNSHLNLGNWWVPSQHYTAVCTEAESWSLGWSWISRCHLVEHQYCQLEVKKQYPNGAVPKFRVSGRFQRCYPIFLFPNFLVSSPLPVLALKLSHPCGEQSQEIDASATQHNKREFLKIIKKKKKLLKANWCERWMGQTLKLIVKLQHEGWALQTALCWVIGVTAGESAGPDLNPHWLNHLYLEW